MDYVADIDMTAESNKPGTVNCAIVMTRSEVIKPAYRNDYMTVRRLLISNSTYYLTVWFLRLVQNLMNLIPRIHQSCFAEFLVCES